MTVETYYQDLILKVAKVRDQQTVTTESTAGAVTYTAAQILGGIILRDPNGASRTDVLPTAALMIGGMRAPRIGDVVEVTIINTADAAETITIDAGSGGAFAAAQTAASKVIGQNASGRLLIRVTGVGSSAAYVVYMAV
jgi:hypothetical protein